MARVMARVAAGIGLGARVGIKVRVRVWARWRFGILGQRARVLDVRPRAQVPPAVLIGSIGQG